MSPIPISDTRWTHEYTPYNDHDCPRVDLLSLWSNKAQCGRACDQDMLCDGFSYLEEERGQPRCWLKRQCQNGNRVALSRVNYYHKGAYTGPGNGRYSILLQCHTTTV